MNVNQTRCDPFIMYPKIVMLYTWNLYSIKCLRYLKKKSSISWLYQCQCTSSKLSSWTIVLQDAAIRSYLYIIVTLVVTQSVSHKQLFATPWTAACQASLSFAISWSLLKLMSIELVIPSNHFILCHPLLLLSIFPNIRVFSNESALHIR